MTSEYEAMTNTQPYPEDLGADEAREGDIQYGVKFALRTGSEMTPHVRWRDWDEAAKHGEGEVKAGRAIGFWVFKEPVV